MRWCDIDEDRSMDGIIIRYNNEVCLLIRSTGYGSTRCHYFRGLKTNNLYSFNVQPRRLKHDWRPERV